MKIIQDQKHNIEAEVKRLEDMGVVIGDKAKYLRDSAFSRFPVVFVLLSAFGLVATFYSFEKLIDKSEFFSNHPEVLLLIGLSTLTFTGTLYKKLS